MRDIILKLLNSVTNFCIVIVSALSVACGVENDRAKLQQQAFEGLTVAFSFDAATRVELESKGLFCIETPEPADPHDWSDNSLCFSKELEGKVKWSHAGKREGMNCRQIHEQAEPAAHTWLDNFLCFSRDVPYEFRWY